VAGEERDEAQPPASRVADRDLLWVESVSERLLGQAAPRAWERAFFRPEATEQPQYPGQRPPAQPSVQPPVQPVAPPASGSHTPTPPAQPASRPAPPVPPAPPAAGVTPPPAAPSRVSSWPPPSMSSETPVTYLAEGDAEWRQDLEPEFPEGDEEDADQAERNDEAPDVVIDITDKAQAEQPQVAVRPDRIDDQMLRLALRSGDTTLASAVLLLLEERSHDRQYIATLETALRALIAQVDRIDAPDHELAVTARLLRRFVDH